MHRLRTLAAFVVIATVSAADSGYAEAGKRPTSAIIPLIYVQREPQSQVMPATRSLAIVPASPDWLSSAQPVAHWSWRPYVYQQPTRSLNVPVVERRESSIRSAGPRQTRTALRPQGRRTAIAAASTPSHKGARSGCYAFGTGLSNAVGMIPAPMAPAFVFGAAAGLIGDAVGMSCEEGREMGQGEAFASVLSNLIPIPTLGYKIAYDISYELHKNKNWCDPEEQKHFYKGRRSDDGTPHEALVAWYNADNNCKGGRTPYDVLRREAGRRAKGH